MDISVVIVTYNRPQDLKKCLESVAAQTFRPREVLVIDNAGDGETKRVVESQRAHYVPQKRENSLTVARNLGVSLAHGDIISFLDDDVVLDKNYYKEMNNFFESNASALGMSGRTIGDLYERNKVKFYVAQIIGKFFLLGFNEKNQCRVLPSMGVTSPLGEKVISSQWLSGASSYRRRVFSEFSFDENLKKYSWGEDTDFSYRVYKKYPGTLFFNPKVKYFHNLSELGRAMGRERAYMEEVYNLYLFYKLIPRNFKNKLAYIWGRVGSIVFKVLKLRFSDIYFSISAMAFSLRHIKEIKKGNLYFFNKTLK